MTKRTVDLVVTFANIASTAPEKVIRRGFDTYAAGSHVLITVEDHMRRSADYLGPEWLTYQGQGHQKGRCSVHLLERRFDVRSHSTPLLNRTNGMDFPGATRYGQVVRSQDERTGRYWNIGGFHLVPHADLDKRPGIITTMPRGRANVMPAIAAMVRALPPSMIGQELWGADVNVDLDSDLRHRDFGMVERFNDTGFRSDVQVLGPVADTHGANEYDWIMGRLSTPAVRFASHSTLPKIPGLDHRARRVTIRSTIRRGFPG